MELGRGFPTPFSNPSIDSTHAPPWNSYTDSFRGKTISAYRVSLLRGWFRLNPRLGEERVQLIFFWEGQGEGIRARRGTKSFSSKVEIYGSKFADWRMKRLDIAWGEMEKGNSSVKEKKEEQVKEVEIFFCLCDFMLASRDFNRIENDFNFGIVCVRGSRKVLWILNISFGRIEWRRCKLVKNKCI